MIDDRNALSARAKLPFQVVAAAVAIFYGFRIDHLTDPVSLNVWYFPEPVVWIVTGLWIVGITNAMNLMDGLDGLAAGIGCIIGATLTYIAFQADQVVGVFTGLAFLGAVLGFLPYNFPPARIFLGDTGALFIGFNLSLLALEGYRKLSVLTFVVPLLALAVPLMDTTLSIYRRLRRRKSILSPDRQHMHHRLLDSEGSHRSAVLSIWFLTACFCVIAVSFTNLEGTAALIFLGAGDRADAAPAAQPRLLRDRRPDRREPGREGRMSARRALVTGVTGQDGSYLAELLLDKGYEVHGMVRRSSTENYERIAHLQGRLQLHQGDLLDPSSLLNLLRSVAPARALQPRGAVLRADVVAQPSLTGEFTALGVTRLLEAVRIVDPEIRFYQASSSEMFGKVQEVPQSETTPFYPRSPYAVAKLFGHWITVNYRESFGLHAVSGILFNHESPRRGREFVSRHVSEAVARIKLGLADALPIGNQDAHRDWGYAPEYVDVMWRMLQTAKPVDYVIGTGVQHSVREFIEARLRARRARSRRLRAHRIPRACGPPRSTRCSPIRARRSANSAGRRARPFAELVRIMVDADLAAQERLSGRRVGGPGTR